MESKDAFFNGGILNGGGGVVLLCENGLEQVVGSDEMGKGGLADEVLKDLDAYCDGMNDRLTVSRMVGDSVIRGVVNAVEQEASLRIRMKELEVADCKERLRSLAVGTGTSEPEGLPPKRFISSDDAFVEQDKMRAELLALRDMARGQFEKFKNEMDSARGCSSHKEAGSGSDLGGVLRDKQSDRWMNLEMMLESLKSTVETICSKADQVSVSSKIFIREREQELDILGKIEDMAKQTVHESVQNTSKKLCEENCHVHNVNWLERLNDVSSLRTQLDSIVKALSIPEAGLVSQGSHHLDLCHHELLNDRVSQSTSVSEESGTLDASVSHVPQIYDYQQLKHMSKEDLVNYFNNVIINMRRDHESALHKMTEKYFCLKREYLKGRGSSVTHRKSEEFDVLRKKIPEVILKLEEFLRETERFPALINDTESLGTLKDKLECLHSENRELRDCLTDKNNKIKCLEAQLSGASEELLWHALTEENMKKVVADLESAVANSQMEAYLKEEVYKCALKELIERLNCNSEESHVKFHMMQEIYEIILKGATMPTETRAFHETGDCDYQSLIFEEVSGLIFVEAIKDAEGKLNDLHREVLNEKENRIFSETLVLQKENELRLEVDENERLKQEMLVLEAAVEQNNKLVEDLSSSLLEERTQLELASRKISSLRENLSQQQKLVAESNDKFEMLSAQLLEAVQQIEVCTSELHNFECRISGAIIKNNLRLEGTTFHLQLLTKKVSVLRKKELMYKQNLKWRYADLQKAESEVDLLGDEVDTLLSLLEKIYIALDHYLPIFKHYPGIIEIHQLIRRELSGASEKLSQSLEWQG